MRKSAPIFLISIFIVSACSTKIHPNFGSNRYIRDINYHVLNDSLQLHHKSLGDVDFAKDKKELKKRLRNLKLNQVLLAGTTILKPYYSYYLLVDPDRSSLNLEGFTHTKDTVLNGHHFLFLGKGEKDRFPLSDFTFFSESIRSGGDYAFELVSLNQILKNNRKSHQFYKAFTEISAYPASDQAERSAQLQYQLSYLSMLGKTNLYDQYLGKWESNYRINEEWLGAIQTYGTQGREKVHAKILQITQDEQIIMFNENHFFPQHRVLLKALLSAFKEQGYAYLALEALADDSLLNLGELPKIESGFYTQEQHYYELLKTAQKLGFKFVAYENTDISLNRELGQAQNLYVKTFGQDQQAKVIVLAGISHISEKPDRRGNKWMAQVFKEKYGIDPVSFSQTHLNMYRKHLPDKLSLINSEHFNSDYLQTVDYHIINQLDWAILEGKFQYRNKWKTTVQLAMFNTKTWKKPESHWDKVPDVSILIEPNQKFSAKLEPSVYKLVLYDQEGNILTEEEIDIESVDE